MCQLNFHHLWFYYSLQTTNYNGKNVTLKFAVDDFEMLFDKVRYDGCNLLRLSQMHVVG